LALLGKHNSCFDYFHIVIQNFELLINGKGDTSSILCPKHGLYMIDLIYYLFCLSYILLLIFLGILGLAISIRKERQLLEFAFTNFKYSVIVITFYLFVKTVSEYSSLSIVAADIDDAEIKYILYWSYSVFIFLYTIFIFGEQIFILIILYKFRNTSRSCEII